MIGTLITGLSMTGHTTGSRIMTRDGQASLLRHDGTLQVATPDGHALLTPPGGLRDEALLDGPDANSPPNTIEVSTSLADGTHSLSTMREMAMRPVNPPKATSMVGQGPDYDDEFRVTRISRGDAGVDLLRYDNCLPD